MNTVQHTSSTVQALFLQGLLSTLSPAVGRPLLVGPNEFELSRDPMRRPLSVEEQGAGRWIVFHIRDCDTASTGALAILSRICGLLEPGPCKCLIASGDDDWIAPDTLAEVGIELFSYPDISSVPVMKDGWLAYFHSPNRPAVLSLKAKNLPYCQAQSDETIIRSWICLGTMMCLSSSPSYRTHQYPSKTDWENFASLIHDMSYGKIELLIPDDFPWSKPIEEKDRAALFALPMPRKGTDAEKIAKSVVAYKKMRTMWISACKKALCMPDAFKGISKDTTFPPVLLEAGIAWGMKDKIEQAVDDGTLLSLDDLWINELKPKDTRPLSNVSKTVCDDSAQAKAITSFTSRFQLTSRMSFVSEPLEQGRVFEYRETPPRIEDSSVPDVHLGDYGIIFMPYQVHSPLAVPVAAALSGVVPDNIEKIVFITSNWQNADIEGIRNGIVELENAGVKIICDTTGLFPEIGDTLQDFCFQVPSDPGQFLLRDDAPWTQEARDTLEVLFYASYCQRKTYPAIRLRMACEQSDKQILDTLSLGKSQANAFPPTFENYPVTIVNEFFARNSTMFERKEWMDTIDEFSELSAMWSRLMRSHGLMLLLPPQTGDEQPDMLAFSVLVEKMGGTGFIDAYYSGVPVWDIVAG